MNTPLKQWRTKNLSQIKISFEEIYQEVYSGLVNEYLKKELEELLYSLSIDLVAHFSSFPLSMSKKNKLKRKLYRLSTDPLLIAQALKYLHIYDNN
jgi:hypothetical protein